jgi:ABC-type transport system involved in cytochrome bd biosynthesis fused ATPase/permease subunit
MIAIGVAYLVVGIIGSETRNFTSQGGPPLVVVGKQSHENKKTETVDPEKSAPAASSDVIAGSSGELALTWRDVRVNIGEKEVLQDISGYVCRGELTALCGASGAGKTTLLSALSQTNFAGELHGEVLVGNKPPGASYRKSAGMGLSFLSDSSILIVSRLRSANGSA